MIAPDRMVQIGSTKADLFGLPPEFRALHPQLERCFDQAVRFRAQPDGAALGQQLCQGGIAFAFMSAGEYAAVEQPGKLTLLASGVNAIGKTFRKAYLVVKAGSHVKTVADCRGKRFAFGVYGDVLTDVAARRALEQAGVPPGDLLREIPLLTGLLEGQLHRIEYDGRLYLRGEAATKIASDLTVNAGVIDQVTYEQMPATGGNLITGPSKDQFKIVGETPAIPEMVVVAGPAADPELVEKFREFLLQDVIDDELVCRQLGVSGFSPPDRAAYDALRDFLAE
jgi:ABC-type phosphate/phosphonate transport system substrate-binding protein